MRRSLPEISSKGVWLAGQTPFDWLGSGDLVSDWFNFRDSLPIGQVVNRPVVFPHVSHKPAGRLIGADTELS